MFFVHFVHVTYLCTEYFDDDVSATWHMTFDGTDDELLDYIEYQHQDDISIYGMYYTVTAA